MTSSRLCRLRDPPDGTTFRPLSGHSGGSSPRPAHKHLGRTQTRPRPAPRRPVPPPGRAARRAFMNRPLCVCGVGPDGSRSGVERGRCVTSLGSCGVEGGRVDGVWCPTDRQGRVWLCFRRAAAAEEAIGYTVSATAGRQPGGVASRTTTKQTAPYRDSVSFPPGTRSPAYLPSSAPGSSCSWAARYTGTGCCPSCGGPSRSVAPSWRRPARATHTTSPRARLHTTDETARPRSRPPRRLAAGWSTTLPSQMAALSQRAPQTNDGARRGRWDLGSW